MMSAKSRIPVNFSRSEAFAISIGTEAFCVLFSCVEKAVHSSVVPHSEITPAWAGAGLFRMICRIRRIPRFFIAPAGSGDTAMPGIHDPGLREPRNSA